MVILRALVTLLASTPSTLVLPSFHHSHSLVFTIIFSLHYSLCEWCVNDLNDVKGVTAVNSVIWESSGAWISDIVSLMGVFISYQCKLFFLFLFLSRMDPQCWCQWPQSICDCTCCSVPNGIRRQHWSPVTCNLLQQWHLWRHHWAPNLPFWRECRGSTTCLCGWMVVSILLC